METADKGDGEGQVLLLHHYSEGYTLAEDCIKSSLLECLKYKVYKNSVSDDYTQGFWDAVNDILGNTRG